MFFLLFWGAVKAFSRYTGLCVNLAKSALLFLKGHWNESYKVQVLLSAGLKSQRSCKCLCIQAGDTTSQQSYSHALQKVMVHAFAMQTWALSLPERVQLLIIWILPLLVYPAREVFPSAAVVSTLTTIYHVALNLNSWGITLDILAHLSSRGGYSLAPPQVFVHRQHSTPFVKYMQDPRSLPEVPGVSFQPFAQDLGMQISPSTLPYFQMGSNVIWNNMPYLAGVPMLSPSLSKI